MKKFFILICFCLLSTSVFSQNGWYLQYSSPYKINDIFFLNETTGWAAGDSGFVAKTTNAGVSWVGQYSPIRVCYNSIHFINENTGWIGGGDDYILSTIGAISTSNGGANWSVLIYSGGYTTISSLQMLNKDTAFIAYSGNSGFSTEGGLVKTTNRGVNWNGQAAVPNNYQINNVHFINNLTGWALAFYGSDTGIKLNRIVKTTNCGDNWTLQYKDSLPIYSPLMQIKFVNSMTGFAVGYNGLLLKTTNGGDNWIRKNTYTTRNLHTVDFIDANTGWIGVWKYGDTSSVLKTTDGGENWVKLVNSYSIGQAFKIQFVNALTGWACGDFSSGKIMKTITGGLTEIRNITSNIPDEFSLLQNFPNPFNPATSIKFQLPKSSFVSLKVFDALGREVRNLVNENLSAGEYEVNFNGSDFNSGIYFYKLETENFSETKKMILVK